ncbi:MAG: TonB-dependent receptor [Bacteroidetes bacterium]|nr:TonB-dependent receptor [Bacteroidota bacterium]
MKRLIFLLFISCAPFSLWAQTKITGTVTDKQGKPVPGANVFIKDTYDGASSDANGKFSFTTDEKGEKILSVTFLGFQPSDQKINLDGKEITCKATLKEAVSELKTVTISAGSFEASDERKITILRPLDIVTTAGAAGDIYGAIQTLPGTGVVGEKEGLYVRGGDASETKTFIDGLLVDNPYFSSVPDVPQRGRFSPFLFKGTSFSSGGYSAQYGQAMSSALILETQDMPEQTAINAGFMSVGGSIGKTNRWKNTSFGVYAGYINLTPYYAIFKQQRDWSRAPQSGNGSLTFRHKTSQTGILKAFVNYAYSDLALAFPDTTDPSLQRKRNFSLGNNNVFTNATYKEIIGRKWTLFTAASFSYNKDKISIDTNKILSTNHLFQSRIMLSRPFGELSTIRFGWEFQKPVSATSYNQYSTPFDETYHAGYAEADFYVTEKLVTRFGGRFENSAALNKNNIAPRASLAYKTGEFSQVSFAYGDFFQAPDKSYLTTYPSSGFAFEKATHYILNFQHVDEKQTFRIEGYYKKYSDLFKLNTIFFANGEAVIPGNSGNGYAKGFELFWRDKKTLKYGDYWISYSFLDTKRNYHNYPVEATPTFAAKHTASVVWKYFLPKWNTFAGFTYVYATGRPYFNPNNPVFLGDRTPDYHNLSLNFNYLTSIKKNFTVLVFSIGNVLGIDQVFTYRYSHDGSRREAIGPAATRTFFAAIFINIGSQKDDSDKYN